MNILVYHVYPGEARLKIEKLVKEEMNRKDVPDPPTIELHVALNGTPQVRLSNGDWYRSVVGPGLDNLRGVRWDYIFAPYGVTAGEFRQIEKMVANPQNPRDYIIYY